VLRYVLLVVAACSSNKEAPPAPKPRSIDAAPRPAFERIAPELARGTHYISTPERSDDASTYLCKLEALFGPPDRFVYFYAYDPPKLGFPLVHTATRTIIVPKLDHLGYAGGPKLGADGRPFEDPTWGLEPPEFQTVAKELDALLATTAPIDCEHRDVRFYRVTRYGIKNGTSVAENLPTPATLDERLATFLDNAEHGGAARARIDENICASAIGNWGEGTPEELAAYPRREEAHARLVRCLETALASLEADIAADGFDADAAPDEAAQLRRDYHTLGLKDAALAKRIENAIAGVRRR
jgi:hypothetical protein